MRPPPIPSAPAYTYPSRATGVKTCAGPLTTSLYRHRNSPVFASTPTRPLLKNCTYCLRPPPCTTTADAYPAWSPPGTADFQMTAPVFLFSATSVASAPPGVTTTTSPSTNGDSEYAQTPGWPPKSLRALLRHRSLPDAASRQTRSPSEPRA